MVSPSFSLISIFILIQATSPFTRPEDIDKAIKKISKGTSVLSVCNFNNQWQDMDYKSFQRGQNRFEL